MRGRFIFKFYERGVILHYNYGEWNVVPLPSESKCTDNWELHSVHFPSTDEGWAVGEHRGGLNLGGLKFVRDLQSFTIRVAAGVWLLRLKGFIIP